MAGASSFVVQSHRGPYVVRRESVVSALPIRLAAGDRLIIDQAVQALYPDVVKVACGGQTLPVTADESLKSLEGLTPALSWLLDSGFSRAGRLYAVGGGTVQDVAGFIASIVHRGIPWVFVPTTLISQGDSCIGSKSSINYGGHKNQLGGFYPPREVLIDERFLSTLPADEVRSGIGEMLHYAALGGETVFAAFEGALAEGWTALTTTDLSDLAMRALVVKQPFVEADEFDAGERKALNLGHTFGHALEFATSGRVPHGVAVAYGIDFAIAYSEACGILTPAVRTRIQSVLHRLVDGSELATVRTSRVLDGIARDKKRSGETVELVLLEALGRSVRVAVPIDDLGTFIEEQLVGWRTRQSRRLIAEPL